MNLVTQREPALDRTLAETSADLFYRSIDRHPRHHLRVREIAARAAHLPDSLVRLLPARLEEIHQRALQPPGVVVALQVVLARDVQGIDHFAIDIELKLLMRGVANTHRSAVLIAGQPRKLHLSKHSLARNSIHDLSILRMTCYCPE